MLKSDVCVAKMSYNNIKFKNNEQMLTKKH